MSNDNLLKVSNVYILYCGINWWNGRLHVAWRYLYSNDLITGANL